MDILISILIPLTGILATFLASKHYYKKSVRKKLTPCLAYSSDLFKFIDKEMRSKLSISYEGKEIENLHELRFIIVNDGEKTISKPISPLTLCITTGEVVNASLELVYPKGRKVDVERSGNIITFNFDLLNKDEKFLVYVLINGKIEKGDYEFTIVAEELPPKLSVRDLRIDQFTHSVSKNDDTSIGFIIFMSAILLVMWSAALLFIVIGMFFLPWAEPHYQLLLIDAGITAGHQLNEILNSPVTKVALSFLSFLISIPLIRSAFGYSKDAYLWYAKLKKVLV